MRTRNRACVPETPAPVPQIHKALHQADEGLCFRPSAAPHVLQRLREKKQICECADLVSVDAKATTEQVKTLRQQMRIVL